MENKKILELKNVSYRYADAAPDEYVLKNTSFSFDKGKVYAIKGKSGSGKTTLLSLISGLEKTYEGSITFYDIELRKMNLDNYRSKDLGIVFQSYNLLPHLTAVENIILSMNVSHLKIKNKEEKAIELMKSVGLSESQKDRRVLRLSGGEQQRIAIARSLSYDPQVILADEPTGNLDKETENDILDILKNLAHKEKKCVIIVTHSENVCNQSDIIYELKKEKNNSRRSKNEKNNKIICGLLVLILIVISAGVIYIINHDGINITFNSNNEEVKTQLKHTETFANVNEGIYITDVSEIVENAMPSIVSITSKTLIQTGMFGPSYFGSGKGEYSVGAGSGIIISEDNDEIFILTNNHVVEGASELTVQFINEKTVDATIKGTSERKDIAVITVKTKDIDKETLETIKIATIGNSNELKVGNGIIAIGNALGYGQSVTTGVISALNRTVTGDNYNNKMIQLDAAINGGNSGGALLNGKGEVIGINSAKYSSNNYSSSASIEGMGFAIPISDVEDLINDLIKGNKVSEGVKLGIEGYMTNTSYNLPSGFYISRIEDGSSADKSELEIGNIITEIDGNTVNSVNDISNVLYEKKVNDTVKLKVKYVSGRDYKEKEITVKLIK